LDDERHSFCDCHLCTALYGISNNSRPSLFASIKLYLIQTHSYPFGSIQCQLKSHYYLLEVFCTESRSCGRPQRTLSKDKTLHPLYLYLKMNDSTSARARRAVNSEFTASTPNTIHFKQLTNTPTNKFHLN
jgi:hypothetical protein